MDISFASAQVERLEATKGELKPEVEAEVVTLHFLHSR